MNNMAKQSIRQVEPIANRLTDTDANTEQEMHKPLHKPLVIAGTPKGLLFLNSQQQIELKDRSITALASSPDGLWAIAERNSVWHRQPNGEWHEVAE
ncbi:MAG: hypothetical protein RLZZ171_1278, partial [Cyanobacteriota bacterium]